MSLTSDIVYKDEEWIIVHRTAQPGDSWVPSFRRNGVVMDVPTDKAAFRDRFPYSPVTDVNADRVFVYRPLQITLSGRMSHGGDAVVSIESNVACAYPADSWQAKLADTPALYFPDGAEFFCCLPQESMLLWERRGAIADAGAAWVVQPRSVARQRLLLVKGTLDVNGTGYDRPAVIAVRPGDTVTAVTKVYAAEVWV